MISVKPILATRHPTRYSGVPKIQSTRGGCEKKPLLVPWGQDNLDTCNWASHSLPSWVRSRIRTKLEGRVPNRSFVSEKERAQTSWIPGKALGRSSEASGWTAASSQKFPDLHLVSKIWKPRHCAVISSWCGQRQVYSMEAKGFSCWIRTSGRLMPCREFWCRNSHRICPRMRQEWSSILWRPPVYSMENTFWKERMVQPLLWEPRARETQQSGWRQIRNTLEEVLTLQGSGKFLILYRRGHQGDWSYKYAPGCFGDGD